MTATTSTSFPATAVARTQKPAPWALIVAAAILLVAAIKLIGLFRLGAGADELQDSWRTAVGAPTRLVAQFSAGPGLLSMARVIVPLIDEAPPEAALALAAVRHASVGIYDVAANDLEAAQQSWIGVADQAMTRAGWTRAIGVVADDAVVVIYVQKEPTSSDEIRVAIGVCDGENLVVVKGDVRMAPLLEVLERQVGLSAILSGRGAI